MSRKASLRAAAAAVALSAADRMSRVVAALSNGTDAVATADTAAVVARGNLLSLVIDSLNGIEPMTPSIWDAIYKEPCKAALTAATRVDADGKTVARYKPQTVTVKASEIMTVACAVTHGINPKPGMTYSEFLPYAREKLATVTGADGLALYTPKKAPQSTQKGATRAPRQPAASEPKKALSAPEKRQLCANFLCGDERLANLLLACLDKHATELTKAMTILIEANAPKPPKPQSAREAADSALFG